MTVRLPNFRALRDQHRGPVALAACLLFGPLPSWADGVKIGAGKDHTCRIRTDDTIACWGYNHSGQATAPTGTFTAVSAGIDHTCGLRTDSTLACWGWGVDHPGSPANAPAGTFTAISAGYLHSCGLRSDGTLACWGRNVEGQTTTPEGSFVAVSARFLHTCGLRSDGTLSCWGWNTDGQASAPTGTFSAVSAGLIHTCGLRSDGTLQCWGNNDHGQSNAPEGTFIAVSAGYFHTCGLRSDGALTCWGYDNNGITDPPTGVFADLSTGDWHACASRSDGTLACWGSNGQGQAPQPAVHPELLDNATAGAAYGQAMALIDARPPSARYPYTPPSPGFAVVSGALPPGMILTAAGLLSGTPITGGSFSFTIEGEDANGFAAQRSYVLAVQGPPDNSAPVIVSTVAGPRGANGWYTGDVTVQWSVSDDESPLTSTTGCDTVTLTTDALGAGYTCTATSSGGTASEAVTVKRDATAPTLAPTVSPSVILLNGNGTVAANASDALSGVASQSCAALDTGSVGSRTSACTTTDNAGNAANATATYSVIYGFIGFARPVDSAPTVNVAIAGQVVPFKWRLVDADGTPVTSLASVTITAIGVPCSGGATRDAVEKYSARGSGLQNIGDGTYQVNWQSPKKYRNSCKKLLIDLGDGSTRVALFRFR